MCDDNIHLDGDRYLDNIWLPKHQESENFFIGCCMRC